MKKLLLLTATVFLLGSCNWGGSGETDETWYGYTLYTYTFSQHEVSMDPYRVAERLNVLLTECNWDIENANSGTRNALLGAATITHSGSGVYVLTFNGNVAEDDDMRQGVITIATGQKLLSEPGANWTISSGSDGYSFSKGSLSVNIKPGTYTVTFSVTNKWVIAMNGFESIITSSNSTDITSSWNSNVVLEQSSGDQSYNSWRVATYLATITVDGALSMYSASKISINTATPLKYNPRICGRSIIGDGIANCWLTDSMSETHTKVTWLGTSLTACNPGIKISYNGYEGEY